jgi:thiol:disulfide interchange protein DsbD
MSLGFQRIWTSLALAVLGLAVPAAAPATESLQSLASKPENVQAELVSEAASITPGETFFVGLHFQIRDGWHTYWRFAGDSGAETTIKWTLPPGFEASGIVWPMPTEVPLGPLMDYGYKGEVTHLVSMSAPANLSPGTSANFVADVEWLVCSDEVCIPGFGKFSLNLPVVAGQGTKDPVWAPRLEQTVAELPAAAPFESVVKVTGTRLLLSLKDAGLAKDLKSGAIKKITYFPYQDGIIRHPSPQVMSVAPDGVAVNMEASYLATSSRLPSPLSGLVVATHADGSRKGYEISAAPGTALAGLVPFSAATQQPKGGSGAGFLQAILLALAGGFVLNLMPCVFPVLSMKALAFARRDQADRKGLRLQGWAYAAGVIFSFGTLAALLFALRGSGEAIGWGYQLQSPLVVLLLAYLMFVVGLILSGVISVGANAAGIGQTLTQHKGTAGSFFTGVLATVVAAPCTAPFMGAALGYAMIAPPATGMAVFLALGVGLALPFLIISHVPAALAWLPKPGAWMERLREFLAFPMYGAAAWLLWVLAQQTSPRTLLAALVGLVLIAFAGWVLRFSGSRRALWFGRGAALAAALSAIGLAAYASQTEDTTKPLGEAAQSSDTWGAYASDKLSTAIAEGRPVFIDATAAWCLTCKVNELSTLSSKRVLDSFKARNVLLLRADWTNRDAEVTELLSNNGRLGVPLYLYYPSGAGGAAKILPQILTEDNVVAALNGGG